MDLTAIGHTHYPFVRQQHGAWLVNSGSIAAPINRWRDTGPVHNRCASDESVPDDDTHCSFLSITHKAGELVTEIIRFDYDRRGLVDRYAKCTGLSQPISLRRVWMLQAFGATGIGMPLPRIPAALSKGVIDGVTLPYEIAPAVKTQDLVSHF